MTMWNLKMIPPEVLKRMAQEAIRATAISNAETAEELATKPDIARMTGPQALLLLAAALRESVSEGFDPRAEFGTA